MSQSVSASGRVVVRWVAHPWLPQDVSRSVGVPPGWGARLAVRRFGSALGRLAR